MVGMNLKILLNESVKLKIMYDSLNKNHVFQENKISKNFTALTITQSLQLEWVAKRFIARLILLSSAFGLQHHIIRWIPLS